MIIPKLYGRLGNQCFQIAAAIAQARKMETSWAIPRITNDPSVWPNYFLHTVPRTNITMYSTRNTYNEPRHCYDALPTTNDLTINGYFQSEKYFQAYEDKLAIGNALNFHNNAAQYGDANYIAIHVRRGDYVTHFSYSHPPLDTWYYNDAIELFSKAGFNRFKIYTDDVEWCIKNTPKWEWWGSYYTISKQKDALADMRDMYNASGFIVANSTFSLFPALLRLDNPLTIAPAENRWYGPGNAHLETIDLLPKRFLKL